MSLKHSTIILFVVFLLLGMSTKTKIVGYWEVFKIEKLWHSRPKEKRNKFIEFHKNGEMSGGSIGDDSNKSGRWEMNKKLQIITFITPDNPDDSGNYTIIKLSKESLVLLRDSTKIYLDRGLK